MKPELGVRRQWEGAPPEMQQCTTSVKAKNAGIELLRSNPGFARYWLSCIVNRFGDSVDSLAYAWMILEMTGSTLMMGTVLAVNMVPNIVLGPFAGVFADRYDRKRLTVLCDLARGALAAVTALLLFTGWLRPWMLYVFTASMSVFEAISAPARAVFTPSMVSHDELVAANSIRSFGESSAQLVGLAVAGALIARLGVAGAIAVDAVCFLAAAALVAEINLPESAAAGDGSKLTPSAFFSELKAGLQYISTSRVVLICIILAGLTNFFLGPLNVLLPVFIKNRLAAGSTVLSLVFTLETLAMVAGSLAAATWAARMGEPGCLGLGFAGIGVGYAFLYLADSIPATVACLAVLGFALPFASTGFTTLMQKSTPLNMMGRISAVQSTLVLSAMPLSTSIAGLVGDRMDANLVFGLFGLMVLASTLSLTYHPSIRGNKASGASATTA